MENSDILASIDLDAITAEIIDAWPHNSIERIDIESINYGRSIAVAVKCAPEDPGGRSRIFAAYLLNKHAKTETFAAILAHDVSRYFDARDRLTSPEA